MKQSQHQPIFALHVSQARQHANVFCRGLASGVLMIHFKVDARALQHGVPFVPEYLTV